MSTVLTSAASYGAASSKILAIYGRRLSPEDFDRMANMRSVGEVASFLKAHPAWSRILRDVNPALVHRGQLEPTLWEALYNEFGRIIRYLPSNDRKFYSFISLNAEISLVLAAVRQIVAGASVAGAAGAVDLSDEASRLGIFVTSLDVAELTNAKTCRDVVKAAEKCAFNRALSQNLPSDPSVTIDYARTEQALTAWQFADIMANADRFYSGAERTLIRDAFTMLADLENIARVLRVSRYFPGSEDKALASLVPSFSRLSLEFYTELFSRKTPEDRLVMLQKTPYKRIFSGMGPTPRVEAPIEDYVEKYFRRLLHKPEAAPLIPLAYLILKRAETRDLIRTIECVRYSLPHGEFSSYLGDIRKI